MKEYQFLVTVYEGSDEWWEELNEMEIEPHKNYYQSELPL